MFGRKKINEYKKIQAQNTAVAPEVQAIEKPVQQQPQPQYQQQYQQPVVLQQVPVQPQQLPQAPPVQVQQPKEPSDEEILDILEGSLIRSIAQNKRALEVINYIRTREDKQ